MSLNYRSNTFTSGERKINKLTKLRNELSDANNKALSDYETLHAELSNAENVKLHDIHLSEENDKKIVRLSELRDDIIKLNAQLEILSQV